MIIREEIVRTERLHEVALGMMIAARTAPKAKGVDVLQIAMFEGDDIRHLSRKMKELAEPLGKMFFMRDADNILQAGAVVLIGAKIKPAGLNCGYCGFPTCAVKEELQDVPCAFNSIDLGIAIGSAVSFAADSRVDSRVMYSVGEAVRRLGVMKECNQIIGIPISCTGKSPFFDRPSHIPSR